MIQRIDPPIPLYVVDKKCEGWAHWIIWMGIENYLYFVVALDPSGEIWTFPNTQVRFCVNYTADRPHINKDVMSQHLPPLNLKP